MHHAIDAECRIFIDTFAHDQVNARFVVCRSTFRNNQPLSRWEDGLLQLDVPKRYMRQFVAEDDASAGKGIPLTADVVQHLTWIGSTVGPVLDEVRKAIHISSLSKVRANRNGRGNTMRSPISYWNQKNDTEVIVICRKAGVADNTDLLP